MWLILTDNHFWGKGQGSFPALAAWQPNLKSSSPFSAQLEVVALLVLLALPPELFPGDSLSPENS